MSTSPRFRAASRVESSGIALRMRRFTLGVLRQYWSNASRTSSTPGVNETNLYGPAPIGAFLKPSSPTFSTYFFGTIHRGRLDRGEKICREGRRRRLQKGADRGRAIQIRVVYAWCRTGDGGVRRVLAQGAERQADRVQGHSRRGD